MTKTNKANLGDIIKSEKFAYGYYDGRFNEKGYIFPIKNLITVDGETKEYPMKFRKPGTPWDKEAEYETVELSAYDESRSSARFVVERAELDGGGTGHGPHDIFPDGWYIKARRLNDDGTYNPNGELIQFYQSGCFTGLIPEVELVGKMKQIFVEEESK